MSANRLAWSLVLVTACGGAPEPAPSTPDAEAPAEAPAEAEPAAEPMPDELPAGDMPEEQAYTMVPPPGELQVALTNAGIDTKLATLVPTRTFALEQTDTDRVAVRTGVIIADVLLTVKTSEDAKLLDQLGKIKTGMHQLEAGKDIEATIDDLSARIEADAVSRDALVAELDELAQVVIPELEFNGVARIVPLIQAGSWLNGAHLVAMAVKAKGEPAAADAILKQPEVVAYFRTYAKDRAEDAVSSAVADALDGSLAKLADVAGKDTPLASDDIEVVITATDQVLALL